MSHCRNGAGSSRRGRACIREPVHTRAERGISAAPEAEKQGDCRGAAQAGGFSRHAGIEIEPPQRRSIVENVGIPGLDQRQKLRTDPVHRERMSNPVFDARRRWRELRSKPPRHTSGILEGRPLTRPTARHHKTDVRYRFFYREMADHLRLPQDDRRLRSVIERRTALGKGLSRQERPRP